MLSRGRRLAALSGRFTAKAPAVCRSFHRYARKPVCRLAAFPVARPLWPGVNHLAHSWCRLLSSSSSSSGSGSNADGDMDELDPDVVHEVIGKTTAEEKIQQERRLQEFDRMNVPREIELTDEQIRRFIGDVSMLTSPDSDALDDESIEPDEDQLARMEEIAAEFGRAVGVEFTTDDLANFEEKGYARLREAFNRHRKKGGLSSPSEMMGTGKVETDYSRLSEEVDKMDMEDRSLESLLADVGHDDPAPVDPWNSWEEFEEDDIVLPDAVSDLSRERVTKADMIPPSRRSYTNCMFCDERKRHLPRYQLDYTNVTLLMRFVDLRGRILARTETHLCKYHQRRVTRNIKRARFIALMSPTGRYMLPLDYVHFMSGKLDYLLKPDASSARSPPDDDVRGNVDDSDPKQSQSQSNE